MTEQNSLVPTKVIEGEVVEGDSAYMTFTQPDKSIIRTPIPKSLDEMSALQTAIVMSNQPQWFNKPLEYLLSVQHWAKSRGVDPTSLYVVEGKLSLPDEVKVAKAMASGRVEYLTVSDVTKDTNPFSGKPDFYVVATMKLTTETKERQYKAWFSEWNNSSNKAWQKYPTDRLQWKAQARVCEMAFPIGADNDSYIPVVMEPSVTEGSVVGSVAKALAAPKPSETPKDVTE